MSIISIGKIFSNFKEFYSEINAATLTGAIDVIVVEQQDGTYNCSPFHVRFGKLGVLRSREKVVDIEINGEPQDIHMKLGDSGEAFFVEELEDSYNEIPDHLATSPIPVSEIENMFTSQGRRRSFDLGPDAPSLENEMNDYTKRRNTGDIESVSCPKNRERDFLKRQIGLGNIAIGENSSEELTLSISKQSNEDISKDNDISDTIFKMDSLEMDPETSNSTKSESINKLEMEDEMIKDELIVTTTTTTITATTTPIKNDEISSESRSSKKKRRKMKKKNAPRKSTSISSPMTTAVTSIVEGGSGVGGQQDSSSATDPSSMESNSSEPELKEIQSTDNNSTIQQSGSTTTIAARKRIDPDIHFFSDTELTTNIIDSRADSPIQIESVLSDSEFEVKTRKGENKDNGQSWEWGGFPNLSQTSSPTIEEAQTKGEHSMISNMLSFMKKNHGQSEGIYLSDIHQMEPEVAALYFSKTKDKGVTDADMDCESGNGPSLTQSPNSREGCKSIDSDFDEQTKGSRAYTSDVTMSLCGWDPEPDLQRFNDNSVTFSDFCNNPMLLDDPNLVVCVRGKYYNWKVAAPIISSIMVFNRPLLQSSIDQLCHLYMPASSTIMSTMTTTSTTTNQSKEEVKREQRSWWSWRRSKSSRDSNDSTSTIVAATQSPGDLNKTGIKETTAIDIPEEAVRAEENVQPGHSSSQTVEETDCNHSSSSKTPPLSDKCRKTLRLTSKQIASLNLRDGMNEIGFSVTTAYQGTCRCTCYLYKWKWDDKIVISDIDGTITKSDVLGHILPIVGKDWAQSGVAQLFNKIKDNGYKILYLSARAIGQARITRDYLKSIKQGDLTMPDGPILLNPTSLIMAFHREVIEKKPEAFKISCLSDIKALFPPDSNPFYAGYGNRINDVWAYTAVGIPIHRIFTINHKGELKHELTQTFQSSYTRMTYFVDQLFPPVTEAANDYSQFSYWRDPLPSVEELPELPS